MKINELAKFVLSVLLAGATIALAAFDPVHDDTDIFLANPNITAERPNVLIAVDNSANWTTPFTNEKNALVQVVNGLSDQYNVGLMIMPETGNPNDSVDGGYVRYAVRQMTLANKSALANIVGNFDVGTDKGNNTTHGAMLYEAYLYFAGKQSIASHGKVKTDKDNTTDPRLTPLTNHALPSSNKDTAPAPLYRSPITDGCARNFIILISNGTPSRSETEEGTMQARLAALTGVNPPAVISVTPNGLQGNWSDEMAKFMANADVMATSASIPNSEGVQNVYTYVVEVDAVTTGQGPDWTAVMKSTAANGKGKYFGVTSSASGTAIVDALNAIFTEVQAVNSVFASTTLPVSVNVRGTNLNQVYIGVFRPDPNKAPRWLGNLKMYNLALNTATSTVFLADAANGPPPAVGNPAENSTTGFISETSPSFWTSNSDFWGFRDPSQNGPGGTSDKPDGDLVEKGGAAQQLRIAFANAEASSPARNLYTCTTGVVDGTNQICTTNSPLLNTPFNTLNDAISAAALQLDTRFVDPLTAYASKPVVTLTDRIPVVYMSNTFGGVYVETLNNGANTAVITNLTTAVPKTVTSLTGLVPNVQTVALSSVSKVSGKYRFQAAAALPSIYVTGATVTISGTSNSLFNANWTIDTVDTGNNRFTITTGPSGSESATGGTATVTSGTINSTTAQATVTAHGYTSGQAVTILGASPVQFNGTYNVTVIDANHFNYTISSAAGNATGTITASGNTTTATATTAGPHGFSLIAPTVTISGASDAAYNGVRNIRTVPSATTFTYCVGTATWDGTQCVGGTPIGPNTNTTGVTAFQGGTITVRARIPDWWGYWCSAFPYPGSLLDNCGHGFTTGQTVFITGSDVSGYNGSFAITVDPPGPGEGNSRSFTFTTATVLPGNTSFNVWAATNVYEFIWGYAFNHNLKDGDEIVIEHPGGADAITGTYNISAVFQSDYFFYIHAPSLAITNTAITKTGYTIRPTGGINSVTGLTGTPPQAYATVSNHGYPNGQEVRIAGASPSGYNGTHTIQTCTGAETYTGNPFWYGSPAPTLTKSGCYSPFDVFTYPLTTALGPNTNLGVTSSIKSVTAQATSVNHGFANGSTVTIAGATPSEFDGTFTISVPFLADGVTRDPDHFTYTLSSVQGDATGTILAAQSGGSSAERDLIVRWVRGEDNFLDENSNTLTTDIRASVHGDVLHSRPAVVNYNRFAGSDDDVFIYYGGNDGVFHAVKGGYAVPSGDSSGLTPGKEAWGFIPEEFFGQFKRMRNNSPLISSSFKKPYFMDGPIGVYTRDGSVPENGKLGDPEDVVNLYVANRRGGRFLYALDVNDPQDPKFLWKITSATTGFSELGQTWSQPTVVSDLAGLSVPVLVFGAGYDPAVEDLDPAVVSSVNTSTDGAASNGSVVTTTLGTVNRAMGRGIYVVNALTGALIWSAGRTGSGAKTIVPGMIYAIPSDITVIRNETTGIVNRAYVGDTGGNMWRIDFKSDSSNPSPNLDLTTVTKLASIADQSTASGRRKFLFPPDVVGQSGFDAVLVGSGDREHPFDSTITNRFYMFKDKGDDTTVRTGAQTCDPTITEAPIPDPTDACDPNPGPIPGLFDATSNCIQDAAVCVAEGRTQAEAIAQLGADRGWFVTLGAGEKVVGNAVSIGGTTFFNTNQPSATAGGGTCGSNLGVARQYQVATANATATTDLNAVGGLTGADRSVVAAGGGYLPSPVHVVVMLGGKPVEAVISGIQVSTPAGTSLSARLRKYWYKEVDPK